MRLIFIAGPDRCGKTTLTDEFVRRRFEYRHFGPPTGSPYKEYLDFAEWLEKNGKPDGQYVIDRFMYCEFPYSKHYGRQTDMTVERMNRIEDILLGLDNKATVVYCSTSLESNWERIEAEGKHEFGNIMQLKALRDEYKRVLLHSKLNVVEYNFETGETASTLVTKIIK